MKNYLTATQEAYDELMIELENKGCMWYDEKPTAKNYWPKNEEKTYVIEDNGCLTCGRMEPGYRELYPFIKYKAKGDNMTQEEMKQSVIDWATDVSVAVEAAIKDMKFKMKKSTVESDLQEAKSASKSLIEKIDEYLESQKPKFKVGDYVIVDVNGRKKIAKIDELRENNEEAHGIWYDKTKVNVKQDYWFLAEGSKFRHARPSEIAEYKAALTFHKHGRKPFEIKRGDLLDNVFGKYIAHEHSFSKEDFTVGGNTLLKTAEEVNEWLGAEYE